MKTRAEHLQWCKDRAMEYYNEGDYASAVASMLSDMKKHPKTALGTLDSTLMYLGNIYVRNNDSLRVKRWIEGFN